VEKLNPSLVLMDLSMPRMGGVEATREIKKNWPKIKVLGGGNGLQEDRGSGVFLVR
jgi:DNA-binding NarL/FixJ family response regulator